MPAANVVAAYKLGYSRGWGDAQAEGCGCRRRAVPAWRRALSRLTAKGGAVR